MFSIKKGNDMMVEIIPEGTEGTGGEKVQLSQEEYKTLTEKLAAKVQAEANLVEEVKELRKKNHELANQQNPVPAEDVSKAVDEEFRKRDAELLKVAKESALIKFLDSHPEFDKTSDTDGTKFAAFQKALARINLSGVKTEQDYEQVLEDALRLVEKTHETMPPNFSSTTPGSAQVPGRTPMAQITVPEQKLVRDNFGGDVEKYLKAKAKRPDYFEELLRWAR